MKARIRAYSLAANETEVESGNRLQPILALSLVLVGMGNIAIPGSWPLVSALYLPLALLTVLVLTLVNFNQILDSLRSVMLLSLLVLSFGMGFFVTPLNPYGVTKLVAFGVSILLLCAPAALRYPTINAQLIIRTVLLVSVVSSIFLLMIGKPDIAGRSTLLGINPISTGRVAGIGVVIALVYLIAVAKKRSSTLILLVIVAVPSTIATFLTGSRGPLVAIIAAVIISLFAGWRRNPKKSFFALLVFLGLGIYLNSLSFDNSDIRIISTDSSGRDILFTAAFESILKNPVGLGWGNFHEILPGEKEVSTYILYPHNIFLEVGVEGGWLALVIFTFLVVASLRNAFKRAQSGNPIAMFMLSMLVFALVNACFSSDLVGNRLMWLFMGLCLLTPMDDDENTDVELSFVPKTLQKELGK